jgi:hypothetical protein
MTGGNPDGIEDFPSPDCSDVAYGPQRLNAIIGAYEAFLDPAPGRAERYRLATYWLPVAPGWLAVLARPATAGVRMKSRTVLIAVASSWLRAHGLISAGVTHAG